MKKIILLLMLAASFQAFSQSQVKDNAPKFKADESTMNAGNKFGNSKRDNSSDWYFPFNINLQTGNILGFIENANGQASYKPYVNFLYPDTSGVIITDNGKVNTYTHAVGNVFDPRDSNISLQFPFAPTYTQHQTYTVDSMGLRFGYHRHLDSIDVAGTMTEVIDTLFIQFFSSSSNPAGLEFRGLSGGERFAAPVGTNFNVNTMLGGNAVSTQTILLDKTRVTRDSTTGWVTNLIEIPVGVSVDPQSGARSCFAYLMTFRPMKKANLGDTLFNQTNANAVVANPNNYVTYFFNSNEANPEGQVKQFTFANNSLFSHKFQKYNYSNNGWTTVIPGNAYFEHQYVFNYYKVSTTNLGVTKTDKLGNGLGEAYPNPNNGLTELNIPFKLVNSADVTISISDITGKTVKTVVGSYQPGTHSVSISTSEFGKGLYVYTMSANGFSAASKFIVE